MDLKCPTQFFYSRFHQSNRTLCRVQVAKVKCKKKLHNEFGGHPNIKKKLRKFLKNFQKFFRSQLPYFYCTVKFCMDLATENRVFLDKVQVRGGWVRQGGRIVNWPEGICTKHCLTLRKAKYFWTLDLCK